MSMMVLVGDWSQAPWAQHTHLLSQTSTARSCAKYRSSPLTGILVTAKAQTVRPLSYQLKIGDESEGILWSAAYEGKGGEGMCTAPKTCGCVCVCPTMLASGEPNFRSLMCGD